MHVTQEHTALYFAVYSLLFRTELILQPETCQVYD